LSGLVAIGTERLRWLRRVVAEEIDGPFRVAAVHAAVLPSERHALSMLDGLAPVAVLALLDAVLAERQRPVPSLELVWTGPEGEARIARDTAVVVRQLFSEAQRDVFVAGFRFDHGPSILQPLHAAMRDRGVSATFCLDLEKPVGGTPAERVNRAMQAFVRDDWVFGDPIPELWYDPRGAGPQPMASLHAKCVVVDGQRALVSSANFTDRGQRRNFEVGVLIADTAFARRLLEAWRGVMASGSLVRWATDNC